MNELKKWLKRGGWMVLGAWIVMEIIKPGWTINVLLGLDIFANTILFGEVETISSRAGKAAGQLWADLLCFGLDLFDPGHCENSVKEVY